MHCPDCISFLDAFSTGLKSDLVFLPQLVELTRLKKPIFLFILCSMFLQDMKDHGSSQLSISCSSKQHLFSYYTSQLLFCLFRHAHLVGYLMFSSTSHAFSTSFECQILQILFPCYSNVNINCFLIKETISWKTVVRLWHNFFFPNLKEP